MNKILIEFLKENPRLIKKMSLCSHSYDAMTLNPYHLEGTIYAHTMLVYNEILKVLENETNTDIKTELKLASLLHDIGKPETLYKNPDKQQNSFINHEALGFFLSIDILKNMKKKLNLSKKNIINISLMVAGHSYIQRYSKLKIKKMFINNSTLFSKIQKLTIADNKGRFLLNKNNKDSYIDPLTVEKKKIINKRKNIYILIGPPLSGKTTYINRLIDKSSNYVISKDAILKENFSHLGNTLKHIKSQMSEIDLEDLKKYYISELKKGILSNKDIYIDANNLSNSEREQFFIPELKDYNKHSILFFTSLSEMHSRNKSKKRVPNFIIDKESKKLEIPLFDKFDFCHYIFPEDY